MARVSAAVILAAGRSTRTEPLTTDLPKPLLKLGERTLLEWNIMSLKGSVDRIILIVGFQKDRIIARFGSEHEGIPLHYVEQKELNGTGGAVLLTKAMVNGRFLIMNGDDLYGRKDVQACLENKFAVMGQTVAHPERFGIFETDTDSMLTEFVEKPEHPKSDLANIGLYLVDDSIFPILEKVPLSPRGEIEITDAIRLFSEKNPVKVERVGEYWLPVGYPWSLLDAKERLYPDRVVSATELPEGAIVRRSLIGSGCTIGRDVTIADSILMDNVEIADGSTVSNSIIMDDAVIAARLVTEDNAGEGTVSSMIKGVPTDSGRQRFGAVLGEGVRFERACTTAPGVKVWPKMRIEDEHLKEDRMSSP